MFKDSELCRGLERWTADGGDLTDALPGRGDSPVKTRSEAKAICAALDVYRAEPDRSDQVIGSPLHTLTALFQQCETEKAFIELKNEGLPRLRSWVQDALDGKQVEGDDVMFILKILAMYRQSEDAELIAQAARLPVEPDAYMWSVIFGLFDEEHPYAADLISSLKDPLPEGFILIAFLDMVNGHANAGDLLAHPFNSVQGKQYLKGWLESPNEDEFSYAHSATAALPFIDSESREELLQLARNHPDANVRLESGWAQAKSGDEAGLELLAMYAANPMFSRTAQVYLEELGHTDRIPEDAQTPDFQALAEMAAWLAHPQEYGRAPDEIEVFDTRILRWPPTNDQRRLWLVKYTYQDEEGGESDIGIGMVGSVTFALFGEATAELSPEELYGLHCCWELEVNDDPEAPAERSADAGIKILLEHGNDFEGPVN